MIGNRSNSNDETNEDNVLSQELLDSSCHLTSLRQEVELSHEQLIELTLESTLKLKTDKFNNQVFEYNKTAKELISG